MTLNDCVTKVLNLYLMRETMHSFFSPANALYEIIVGVTCLAIWFGAVFSIPALVALMVDGKEEAERQNS